MKVRQVDDFQSFRDIWNVLLERNVLGNNVFLTWEWLSTWWKHFGEGRRLLLLTVEDRDEIIAIAPLMLSKYKLPVLGSVRKIEFLGVRHSDYNNFIILEMERECLKLITDYLMNAADWDWIEFKEIPETPENAIFLENLFSEVSRCLNLKKKICNICPYVSLPNSFDLLIRKLSKNMRQNLNKYLRRIREKHRVELKRYDEAGFSVLEAMKIFLELHERRWASKSLSGSFKSKEASFLNFHLDVAERFAQKNWLGLYFLTADDEPVAVQYNFEYGGKIYYYLGGFDPQFSCYSVGNLLTMFVLDRCIKRGFKEYDMMRGDEPYKLFWTSTFRRNFEVRLVPGKLTTKFYDWLTWNSTVNDLAGKLKLSLKRDHTQ